LPVKGNAQELHVRPSCGQLPIRHRIAAVREQKRARPQRNGFETFAAPCAVAFGNKRDSVSVVRRLGQSDRRVTAALGDEAAHPHLPGDVLARKDIFLAEFPDYELVEEAGWGGPDRSWIFRFRKGGEDKLVVELLPENSSAVKLREKCRKQGLPYLRYYTNHEGWWNTRSYVVNRTRAALGD
jgi:hypothetical protein